jgi:alpha-tubulin suppressor-like RCC1 family protein
VWQASFAGTVLVWGRGRRGQLGCGRIQRCTATKPKLVRRLGRERDAEDAVVAVSAAKTHTLALTSAGCVLACGAGRGGRLGGAERRRGRRGRDAPWVRRLASLPPDWSGGGQAAVKQVAAGRKHSLLLTTVRCFMATRDV